MAIKKPLRIGVLVPQLVLDGDLPHADAAALVLWSACLEACARHATLSVLEAAATPLEPHDGHLAPADAVVGATPNDRFYAPTRRDELIWLSVSLPRTVTLHAIARDGSHNKFEGSGRSLGDQIDQALNAWLVARKLGALPKKIGTATADELFAATRAIAPALVERASAPARTVSARPHANRVPAGPFRTAALRTLALAVNADLADVLPESLDESPATTQSSRAIGGALDEIAAAGAAVLAHPRQLVALERYAVLLDDARLGDEGVRLLERVARHDNPAAHLALLDQLRERDREGAWLAQAVASARTLGSPLGAVACDDDQLAIDLALSEALIAAGRREEAIALRGQRLAGREDGWVGDAQELARWRTDESTIAWADAREAAFRAQPARALAAFARCEPGDAVDVALELDALVALGREAEVVQTWDKHGTATRAHAVARLAAARALLSAGMWKRGLAELWRVELGEPGRDEQVAIAHCGLLLSCAPLDVLEGVLGEHIALGASALARRMARDLADFVPTAAGSAMITRALGKQTSIDFDPATLAGFHPDTAGKAGIDAVFAALGPLRAARDATEELAVGDRLVNNWLDPVLAAGVVPDVGPEAIAQAAAYAAANALGRYLALATGAATPLAGALRTVAAEALALVRVHRAALHDRDARAVLGVIDPVLRRVERWVGSSWLGVVERSLGLDERAAGDVAGFAPDCVTINTRITGPEETAVLAASIARLVRERPANWASAVAAQATLLSLHTGFLGTDAWAEAIAALLAAKEIELDDAIDELLTASYLAEGTSAAPAFHAARVLLDAGRGPAAFTVLTAALPAADEAWRERHLSSLGEAWTKARADAELGRASVIAPAPDVTLPVASVPADAGWRARRRELEAARERTGYASLVATTPLALAAARRVLSDTVGLVDRDAMIARLAALRIREQANFARDPAPLLAPRLAGELPPISDRVVVPGSPIARISEYVALLRDLAVLSPREALAQFSLDEETYRDVAQAWATALSADPTLAPVIAAGLAKR